MRYIHVILVIMGIRLLHAPKIVLALFGRRK